MSIKINKNKCIGCNLCAEICPGNLIDLKNGKAGICNKYECWDCAACIKECPVEAIEMYLPAEIGGQGSVLSAKKTKDSIIWKIKDKNGEIEEIEVKNRESFKY